MRSPRVGPAACDDSSMEWDPGAARAFVYANARLLEQRVYATLFDGASPAGCVAALAAYKNDDGGFGWGLEPDKRAPDSQPLDVEIAFERLVIAGAHADDLVAPACDWLASIAAPSGAVPILLPSIAGYPRAPHWEATDFLPGLNPTAAIAAHAHALGCHHPWVERATEHCLLELEAGRVPNEAHDLLGLCKLMQHAPDQDRAQRLASLIASALASAAFMKLDPAADVYGVTPLEFAPTPDSIAVTWFGDGVVAAHLDHLERQQEHDGGWPISWEPPSAASGLEWRGIRTLLAARTLTAYGRSPD